MLQICNYHTASTVIKYQNLISLLSRTEKGFQFSVVCVCVCVCVLGAWALFLECDRPGLGCGACFSSVLHNFGARLA